MKGRADFFPLRVPMRKRVCVKTKHARVEKHFNAEGAEFFAKERRERLSFAYLCECLSVLCV